MENALASDPSQQKYSQPEQALLSAPSCTLCRAAGGNVPKNANKLMDAKQCLQHEVQHLMSSDCMQRLHGVQWFAVNFNAPTSPTLYRAVAGWMPQYTPLPGAVATQEPTHPPLLRSAEQWLPSGWHHPPAGQHCPSLLLCPPHRRPAAPLLQTALAGTRRPLHPPQLRCCQTAGTGLQCGRLQPQGPARMSSRPAVVTQRRWVSQQGHNRHQKGLLQASRTMQTWSQPVRSSGGSTPSELASVFVQYIVLTEPKSCGRMPTHLEHPLGQLPGLRCWAPGCHAGNDFEQLGPMGVLGSCCIAALLHVLPAFLQGSHVGLCCLRLLLSCKPASTFAKEMKQCDLLCAVDC